MEEKKTQQLVFVNEALAQLFHFTPREFFRLLHQDGNVFLRFYWDRVGKELKLPSQPAPDELNYEIRQPSPETLIALITLPIPKIEEEAYFSAMVYRPHRVTPILRISDTTKMLVLENRRNSQGQPITALVELTKKLRFILISRGPDPELEGFYAAVLDQI